MTPELTVIESQRRTKKAPPLMEIEDLSLWYDDTRALDCVSYDLFSNEILAFIGPTGCGKSTALKCLNRMHDGTRGVRMEGEIRMGNAEIHDRNVDPALHRRRFGWVAQKPNPYPISIFENVAYGARIHGQMRTHAELAEHVERCLRRANLWDEVKDQLQTLEGTSLSLGQQQRLCIVRALAMEPDVLLMDEPTGSIDPVATAKVEELILDLKVDHSVVVVTHSLREAKRIADRVAYFHLGRLLELAGTEAFFAHPITPEARAFVEGRMG